MSGAPERAELVGLILTAVREQLPPSGEAPPLTEETVLFGKGGLLDSLGLVNVVLDVEQQVNDRVARPIALADERAMSQTRSPFRTAGALADYVLQLVGEGRA